MATKRDLLHRIIVDGPSEHSARTLAEIYGVEAGRIGEVLREFAQAGLVALAEDGEDLRVDPLVTNPADLATIAVTPGLNLQDSL